MKITLTFKLKCLSTTLVKVDAKHKVLHLSTNKISTECYVKYFK